MRNASSRRRISTSFAVWSATLCPRSPPSRRPVRFVHRPDHAANDTCRRNQPSSVATFARVDDLLGFPLATRRTASMQNANLSALEAKHAGIERHIVVESQRPTPDTRMLADLKKLKTNLKQERTATKSDFESPDERRAGND